MKTIATSSPTQFFDEQPAEPGSERFDLLFTGQGVRIERITSSGSQPAQAYDQPQDEWVILLKGTARMRIAQVEHTIHAGDFIHLPAHTPHEVTWTSENAIWLAVHLPPQG